MTILLAAVCIFWILRALDIFIGQLFFVPHLKKPQGPFPGKKVSVIFAARDEAAAVGAAVDRLLLQNYPDFEVIAVDDRSVDGTSVILGKRSDPRLKVIRVDRLPEGWLGKTHALYEGYRASSGEWLVFTDADVMMESDALSAAVAEAEHRGLGHLTAAPSLVIKSYVEAMFISFFMLQFNMRYRPWAARFKGSAYMGIGAFNMVRRAVYEKAGTHEALKLEIADDMILGEIAKRTGARSMFLFGKGFMNVRWVSGFRGVLESLQKNAFRGLGYSVPFLIFASTAIFAMDVLPFVWIFTGEGASRLWAAGTVVVIFSAYAVGALEDARMMATFPAHPVSALLFVFILWRSALTALFQGGVRWRGTFYRLEDLKRYRV